MENFKNEIKRLVELKKSFKLQRKTINFTGIRTHEPKTASYECRVLRETLRSAYVAYGIAKGKTYQEIESNAKEPFTEEQIKNIVKKWKGYM